MKYLLLVLDGITDERLAELDGKTPLQVARTPYMDKLASKSIIGAISTVPEGMELENDIANMAVLGYDPRRYYRGRGPNEAVALEIPMEMSDIAFRADLVATDGEVLLDSTACNVSTEESRQLMVLLSEKLSTRRIKFYPNASYRNIMVWSGGSEDVQTTNPSKLQGKPFEDHLPVGDGEDTLRQLIYDSLEILNEHPINRRRRDEGIQPSNMLWFWAQGHKPELPSFFSKYGLSGSVIAADDSIRGIGRSVGLRVVETPQPLRYTDTNYTVTAHYALAELKKRDFVWVNVDTAAKASFDGDIERKIDTIQHIDSDLVGTILNVIGQIEGGFRLLIMPSLSTSVSTCAHINSPVPFLMYASNEEHDNNMPFDERAVEDMKIRQEEGFRLIDEFLK